jgi:hypothetical protein
MKHQRTVRSPQALGDIGRSFGNLNPTDHGSSLL